MNLKGRALQLHVPESVRRDAIRELFEATASAFGVPMPELGSPSAGELLDGYARFTAEHAAAAAGGASDVLPIRRELYGAARAIGTRLRRELGVNSAREAMAVARAVYDAIGIDFAAADGEVRVARCYFARFYSAAACGLMSSLDQGLIAGLTAGGLLEFRQRMTEGAACCAATFAEARP